MAKRYTINDISGVRESYAGNPGGVEFTSLGQVVFALNSMACGGTCLGQCTCGAALVPWGLCCSMPGGNNSSACSCQGSVACGFSLGGATSTYVALGSVLQCGATLWRRIS